VRLRVNVIAILGSTLATVVAKGATTSIPIVFQIGGDPVQIGLVASLNRPGGNVTGVTSMNADLVSKQLGLVHELMPRAARFGLLVNPNYPFTESLITDARSAAMVIGLQIEILAASTNRGIDAGVCRHRAETDWCGSGHRRSAVLQPPRADRSARRALSGTNHLPLA
jgi:putative ABC transport system substrate-binding protein